MVSSSGECKKQSCVRDVNPFHELAKKMNYQLIKDSTRYQSEVNDNYMKQLEALHSELLPCTYPPEYYQKIRSGDMSVIMITGDILLTPFEKVDGHSEQDESSMILKDQVFAFICFKIGKVDIENYNPIYESVVNYFMEGRTIYISTLGVMKEFRGKSFAKLLLKEAYKFTKSMPDVKNASLNVYDKNVSAYMLYLKEGFFPVEIKPNYRVVDGISYDSTFMVKLFPSDKISSF